MQQLKNTYSHTVHTIKPDIQAIQLGLKSNNKTLTAWVCGLPVTSGHDWDELRSLMDWGMREISAADGWSRVRDHYQTEHTVKDWLKIFKEMNR